MKFLIVNHYDIEKYKQECAPLELSHMESFNGKGKNQIFPSGNHIPDEPWKIKKSHCSKEVGLADTKQ